MRAGRQDQLKSSVMAQLTVGASMSMKTTSGYSSILCVLPTC